MSGPALAVKVEALGRALQDLGQPVQRAELVQLTGGLFRVDVHLVTGRAFPLSPSATAGRLSRWTVEYLAAAEWTAALTQRRTE